jgi:hypothetical protein
VRLLQPEIVVGIPKYFTQNIPIMMDGNWGMTKYPDATINIFDRYGKQFNLDYIKSNLGLLMANLYPLLITVYVIRLKNSPTIRGHFSLKG